MNISPQKPMMSADTPEQLLDAFKAAALSVTRLYRTSAAAQTRARSDGYQDCLDDLLAFLDKESLGLDDGEGWKIRRWATERLDGRAADAGQAMESEDDVERPDVASSPELQRSTPTISSSNTNTRADSSMTAPAKSNTEDSQSITVPTQDSFTFQSPIPYPQQQHEPSLAFASLDLSDSTQQQQQSSSASTPAPSTTSSRSVRLRHAGSGGRPVSKSSTRLGKGAGQKRRPGDDLADIFNIGSLGYNGKDFFGPGAKRSRHT